MGGYASGHEVLEELINFIINVFVSAKGRQLTTIECHSVVCKIASVVVCGGVRRSALISLSDLDDKEMSVAKSGNWFENNIHYSLANNSAVYTERPSVDKFLEEWTTIYKSHSGERGFFNRESCQKKAKFCGRRE
jgi:ribonucleoside-diphosphate reductase alpha chain